MKTEFNWGDDIIDSRFIIARYEELNAEYQDLLDNLDKANEELTFVKEHNDGENDSDLDEYLDDVDKAQEALDLFNQSFDRDELDTLTQVINEFEGYGDWNYGSTLIHERAFVEYTEDLIKDTCNDVDMSKWPWNHLDFEAAAKELKNDFSEFEVNGETYFVRA